MSADEGLSVTDETVETIDTEPAAEPAAAAVATVETPAPAVEATAKVPTRSRRAGQPIQTVGRRKEAIVRVRLVPGTGKFLLNGRELENYFPSKVHQQAVKGMLPHNRLASRLIRKLKVYAGPEHPHAAQQPVPFEIKQIAQ